MPAPHVSVVVCTRNRAESLRDALGSLIALDSKTPAFEIVVIDNGSTDHTADVVSDTNAKATCEVRHVFEPVAGIVSARNRGIREARGEWIAYFDDDQLAEVDWLTELVGFAESRELSCVGGHVALKLPEGFDRQLPDQCRMLLGESIGPSHPCEYGGKLTPGAGNLLIRKSLFDRVGRFRFDATGRGEDTDLYFRILDAGEEVWFVPTATIWHVIPRERLNDEYFQKLTRIMFEGLAEEKRERNGWVKFALYWLAKALHTTLVLAPRKLLGRLVPNADRQLDLRLRSLAARILLREGWPLLFTRSRRPAL